MAKVSPERIKLLTFLDTDRGSAKMLDAVRVREIAGIDGSNNDIDSFVYKLEQDGYVRVVPRSVQGVPHSHYEIKITTKGAMAVQSDRLGDVSRSEQIAKKFRELADLFDVEKDGL
jgi:hypothetical protein